MSDDNEHEIEVVFACARAAHEVNRAYCIALGDKSQVHWDDASDEIQQSAIKGVIGVLVSGNGPRESHESWLRDKREHGWAYGPEKNTTEKLHPCFVEYDDLSEAQRRKDDLFVSTVTSLARALGWK